MEDCPKTSVQAKLMVNLIKSPCIMVMKVRKVQRFIIEGSGSCQGHRDGFRDVTDGQRFGPVLRPADPVIPVNPVKYLTHRRLHSPHPYHEPGVSLQGVT